MEFALGILVLVVMVGIILGIDFFARRAEKEEDENYRRWVQERKAYEESLPELLTEYVIVCTPEQWPKQWQKFEEETLKPHRRYSEVLTFVKHIQDYHYITVTKNTEWDDYGYD